MNLFTTRCPFTEKPFFPIPWKLKDVHHKVYFHDTYFSYTLKNQFARIKGCFTTKRSIPCKLNMFVFRNEASFWEQPFLSVWYPEKWKSLIHTQYAVFHKRLLLWWCNLKIESCSHIIRCVFTTKAFYCDNSTLKIESYSYIHVRCGLQEKPVTMPWLLFFIHDMACYTRKHCFHNLKFETSYHTLVHLILRKDYSVLQECIFSLTLKIELGKKKCVCSRESLLFHTRKIEFRFKPRGGFYENSYVRTYLFPCVPWKWATKYKTRVRFIRALFVIRLCFTRKKKKHCPGSNIATTTNEYEVLCSSANISVTRRVFNSRTERGACDRYFSRRFFFPGTTGRLPVKEKNIRDREPWYDNNLQFVVVERIRRYGS